MRIIRKYWEMGVIVGVVGLVVLANAFSHERPPYGGNPNTAVLAYTKKCEPITRAYLGPTGHKIISLAEYKLMSADLTSCVARQSHGAPTVANSRGGFGSWIPNVFKLGNANEGK